MYLRDTLSSWSKNAVVIYLTALSFSPALLFENYFVIYQIHGFDFALYDLLFSENTLQ